MTQSQTASKGLAELNVEQLRQGIDRLNRLIDRVGQFDASEITDPENMSAVEKMEAAIDEGLARTFGPDTLDYLRYQEAFNFDKGPRDYPMKVPVKKIQRSLEKSRNKSKVLLEQAVEILKERLEEKLSSLACLPAPTYSRKIFIVHGHARAEQSVARFLEQIGLEPVILHEIPSKGQTIIEKFESSSDVGFAIILLTPDDIGAGQKERIYRPRARQNVILELGYFIGRLGRSRVCALKEGDVELPSDVIGVAWLSFDDHGGWQMSLAKELEAAEYSVDWNVVMRG